MCKAMEDMLKEDRINIAIDLIKDGTISLDKIAAICKLTAEEVKELAIQPV